MFDEIDKSELTAPGARYKRASDIFDEQFDFHMQQRHGDVGAAVGDMLAMSDVAPELGEAIIFKSLCAFAAEAKAAQRVLVMTPGERLKHAQELFAARFAECMQACAGNVAEVFEQLLAAALCDRAWERDDLPAPVLFHGSSGQEACPRHCQAELTADATTLRPARNAGIHPENRRRRGLDYDRIAELVRDRFGSKNLPNGGQIATLLGQTYGGRSTLDRLQRDLELAEWLRTHKDGGRVADIRSAAIARFVAARVPSQTTIAAFLRHVGRRGRYEGSRQLSRDSELTAWLRAEAASKSFEHCAPRASNGSAAPGRRAVRRCGGWSRRSPPADACGL